jgi:Zn-dependent protease
MFGRRMTLGRILGFEIRADTSWVLLFLLILWSLASGFFPVMYPGLPSGTAWSLAFVGTVGLFASLIFHELSHALVARRFGLTIGGITLFLFGGVAEMQSEPTTPRSEFLMAGAGPLASIVLGAAFFGVTVAMGATGLPEPVVGVPYYLAIVNVALAVFNMLPAFPMDGGRLLRAALWRIGGNLRRATKVASRLGQGLGIALMAAGVFQAIVNQHFVGGMWWFLIGLFIHGNAGATYRRLLDKMRLEGLAVRDVMTRRPVSVNPETSVRDLVDDIVYRYHYHRYPVVEGERLVGWIGSRQVKAIAQAQWPHLRVRDVMAPADGSVTIAAGTDAETALDRLQQAHDGWLIVTEGTQVVGVVALRDLQTYLQLRAELGGKTMPPTRPTG